jgi:hypothetical protein
MSCWAYQDRVSEDYMFNCLKTKLEAVEKQNKTQDVLIDNIIQTEAMQGRFDRKE